MENYYKYKNIKDAFQSEYKGVKLNQIIAIDIISHVYGHILIPKISLIDFFRRFRFLNVFTGLESVSNHPGVIMSHANWQRMDYVELVELMNDSVPQSKVFNYKTEIISRFNLYKLFRTFIEVFRSFRPFFSFGQVLFLVCILLEKKEKIDRLYDLMKKSKIKSFIAFNSSVSDDAIMCSVLRKLNIKTYSLQHGFYSIYENNIPLDIINYENITADFLLCWGNSTVKNLKKFGVPVNKLIIFGNPRIVLNNNRILKTPKFTNILVLLGRDIYHKSNLELIKLLEVINHNNKYNFILKLHPTLPVKSLNKFYSASFSKAEEKITVAKTLEIYNCDLAISNNTSAFFDSFLNGVICLRYGKYENENFGKTTFMFNDLKSFIKLKDNLIHEDQMQIKKKIEYLIGENLSNDFSDNIKKVFSQI
jgi:hypothetical protein